MVTAVPKPNEEIHFCLSPWIHYERFIKHLRKRGLSPLAIHHFKEYLSPDTRQGRRLRARKCRKLVL
jgi:hypothetical protein